MLKSFDAVSYERFLEYACEKHVHLSRALKDGLRRHLSTSVLHALPRVLDIGAGQGNLTVPLLQALDRIYQQGPVVRPISVMMIEPDALMLTRLIQRVTATAGSLKHMAEVYARAQLEDLLKTGLFQKQSYSFILASHVLYYFRDWGAIVADLRELLGRGGVLCVVLKSDDTDLYRLRRELPWPDEVKKDLSKDYFARDLVRFLRESGISYQQEQIEYPFEVPVLSPPQPPRDEIEDLIAFWYGIERDRWNAETRLMVNDFLSSRADPAGMVRLTYKESIFWIFATESNNDSGQAQ